MTRNNWIALAILTSAAALGACRPKGGEAGQPDRAVDNTAGDQSNLPVSFTVPAGTRLDLTLSAELSSRKNKAGDTFTAKLATDIRDASGKVVIETGSTVNGTIAEVKPAPNRRTPGTLTLALTTIETNGTTLPIRATIDSVQTEYAAAGAVVGQTLSKSTKGTVIGAVVTAETKDLDIVLPVGSHILATITEPMNSSQ
ncbi:MAG TPA: hypothetical protein VKC15_20535 [Gemmatimonadales bacterium]|nr:hypothetical protein [Gemmatimonadales bacterium]